ncbi:hypothetical protein RFI_25369 [Reticulomyxa filosa]|uniref:Uncharacterized protein n=1 Tax=Reticulomyxa filosa TaxID=46433 RepID=X6MF21_RETFI|nr:hypothetical protein RFI_25369 [Reticulomyxa filosa]|eukprot:ETO12007.1 hypothetical protein RFI_25369 [Reticulomyxa filosa]
MSSKYKSGKLSKQTGDNNIWVLQQNFPEIEKEIILQAWNCCDEDIDETNEILHCINDNRIFHHDQKHFLSLLEDFGNRVNKTEILNIWKQCRQISYETRFELEKICSSRDTNRSKEREELMIVRSMSLYILWNILNHSRTTKYRQISCYSLHKNLRLKCDQLGANFVTALDDMEYNLHDFGFEKINDEDWCCQQDIQILHLWDRYCKWIKAQLVYSIYYFLYKTKSNIPERIFMLMNGKWREYEIVFDYEYRRVVLFENKKLKVKSLQLGNPKTSSLEFNVSIQWYNDLDINNTHSKRFCLILNDTWHFCTFDCEEREKLSDCCSVNAFKYT